MAGWILPTLGFILLMGASGITAKLAVEHIGWQQLVYWVPVAYIILSTALGLAYHKPMVFGVGGAWALATGFAAAGALILFFLALTKGDASLVTPATSAYPAVTLVGSAIFLSESLTVARVIGTVLVVAGVVVISRF